MYDPARGYPVVVPCVLYDDPVAAAEWLTTVLLMRPVVRAALPDGWVGHVELARGGSIVLLARKGGMFAGSTSVTQVFVDDVVAACGRAAEAGGTVLEEPRERPWGVREAVLADPEGQTWVVCEHLRDTDPADWYGTVWAGYFPYGGSGFPKVTGTPGE
ncbi:VOC family protein [Actinoplanes subtropicus]|uniref:VOC family protein n=1 Tax=Actinoplanes subtropicus TaxID=543632 RepID=UPI00068A94AC|nr:VOC family protein [Actinoplanes subtropicus]